jgi:FkbM family methyltransferase
MIGDLIYDVGMHDGTDTDFYLKKGFRVVAIEADPALAAQGRDRFTDAIASGQLTILNLAVSEREGVATFYYCPEQEDLCGVYSSTGLSTTVREVAEERSARIGVRFETIEVESRRFGPLLQQYGIPYYLKVDIEGADRLCLEALAEFSDRPKYVSVEIPNPDRDYMELCQLYLLDYRQFKVLDQRFLHKIRLPFPAREGKYVSHQFQGHTSGPFGDETPGRWASFDEIIPAYGIPRGTDAWLWGSKDAWFDLHAKLGGPPAQSREFAGLYSLGRVAIRRGPWRK